MSKLIKTCNQPIAVIGMVTMLFLSACEKKDDDKAPEKTYTETFKKSFGGDNTDDGIAVCQTADGGYMLAGSTMSNKSGDVGANKGQVDVFIVKTDAYGNKVWTKNYGGSDNDGAAAITATADGGFVILANTYSSNSGDVGVNNGNADLWVFKIDSIGKLVWQKTLGGSGFEYANDMKGTPDGGVLVVATSSSYMSGDVTTSHGPGGTDAWVVKLDANGKLLWQRSYGGIGAEIGEAITVAADGGFVVAGSAYTDNSGDVGPNKGWADMWVVKADATGKLLWHKEYGGSDEDYARDIIQSADGGYVIAANTKSNNGDVSPGHGETDIWVVKLDANGTLQWQKTIGGSKGEDALGIVKSAEGGNIIAGNTYSSNSGDVGASKGSLNIWLVKLSASGTITAQDLMGLDNPRKDEGGNVGYTSGIIGVSGSYVVMPALGYSPHVEFGTESDMYIVKTREP